MPTGIANVTALREEFGANFADFIHILDPLEPGIVVGKSSAMAWGGRYLYRLLVRERGMDPRRILVTDLDADYRVHPQYFSYLTWMHLTDPNRETQLYQPIPYFHNNIWEAPMLVRLFAAVLTQLQMWRSVLPEKLQSFGSLLDNPAPGARGRLLGDRRHPGGQPLLLEELLHLRRSLPGSAALHPDLRRRGARADLLALDGGPIPAGASLGVGGDRYPVRDPERDPRTREISLWSRVWRILNLFGEHINWAIAPFVIMFGATVPLVLNPAFAQTTLGQNLPLYASTMLSIGLVALAVLIWVEHRIVPPRPPEWGPITRVLSYIQWVGLPFVGVFFSNLPALDAQTRLLTGRYLEYKVTEKA